MYNIIYYYPTDFSFVMMFINNSQNISTTFLYSGYDGFIICWYAIIKKVIVLNIRTNFINDIMLPTQMILFCMS